MSLAFIGNLALGLAIINAALQLFIPRLFKNLILAAKISSGLTLAQFFFAGLTLLTLAYAYVISDFSIVTVALHSHTTKPLIYKIAGVWGNHEGSILLWVFLSTGMASAYAFFCATLSKLDYIKTLEYLGWINFAFFLFILLTSNPFFSTGEGPAEGMGMNPLLQDPSMAFHPPLLYLGYVGFCVPFAMTLAGLTTQAKDRAWIKTLRPWVLFAWSALTIGITLGSYWAYYELGWGGWWFWDPVENASLMPWCFATALLHCLRITVQKLTFQKTTLSLVFLSFIFCILGAFLTRSGVLSSVHSFANSPERGYFILSFIGLVSPYFLYHLLKSRLIFNSPASLTLFSREGAMMGGIILFNLMALTIFLGTFYPLYAEVFKGQSITLEAPFFTLTVVPLAIPLMGFMAIAPLLSWNSKKYKRFLYSLQMPLFFFMISFLFCLFIYQIKRLYEVIFISLAFCIVGSLISSWHKKKSRISLKKIGMTLAHLGFALSLLGMAIDSYNVEEAIKILKIGQTATLGSFTVKLASVQQAEGPNFRREIATLEVFRKDSKVAALKPEKRLYHAEKALLSEVALKQRGFSEIYAVLGEYQGNESWTIRVYYHPLVLFIWLGGLLIGLGGLLAIFKNRKALSPESSPIAVIAAS